MQKVFDAVYRFPEVKNPIPRLAKFHPTFLSIPQHSAIFVNFTTEHVVLIQNILISYESNHDSHLLLSFNRHV